MNVMIIQYIKAVISLMLSLFSIRLFLKDPKEERKLCMVAMILSSCGDIFMTDVLKLGSLSTYPGAAFFIFAHTVYAVCFFRAGKRNNLRIVNRGFALGMCFTLLAVVLLTVLMFIRTGQMQPMYFPLLGYIAFIGLNLVSQFAYGFGRGGRFCFLPLAMTLFMISDILVFLPMLDIVGENVMYNILIWLLYIPAQLLIMLFNSAEKPGIESLYKEG